MGHPSAHHGAWGSALAITFDETLLTSKNGRVTTAGPGSVPARRSKSGAGRLNWAINHGWDMCSNLPHPLCSPTPDPERLCLIWVRGR